MTTTPKVALITGVTGQDGSYLAEFLLEKGYTVHGIKRRASSFNTQRVDHLYQDPHVDNARFKLHYGDLSDSSNLTRIIQETQPDEIYNLGAQSHVAVSFESPEYTADVDGMGTLRILEAIRILGLEKKTSRVVLEGLWMRGASVTTYDPVAMKEARQIYGERKDLRYADTLNLACQAAAAGVNRFVFISSVKVNGEFTPFGSAFTEADAPNPQDAYGQSKHEAEQGLRQLSVDTGMEVVIIRPPLVYGPGVKANFAALMRVVQRGWPLPLGAVHNQRSLVALDNLVDFIITCITHPQAANQAFLVSDGQDLSTTELVRGMAQAAGVPARLLPVPVWALQAGASLLGMGDAVQRLCGNLQVDTSKARSLLGWVPPVSVEEGLRRAMAV